MPRAQPNAVEGLVHHVTEHHEGQEGVAHHCSDLRNLQRKVELERLEHMLLSSSFPLFQCFFLLFSFCFSLFFYSILFSFFLSPLSMLLLPCCSSVAASGPGRGGENMFLQGQVSETRQGVPLVAKSSRVSRNQRCYAATCSTPN